MKKRILLLICLVCAFALLSLLFPSKNLSVHFLNVGQADSAIVLCDDKVLMIDGGNPSDSSFIFSYLKHTLGIDHIDYIIATHPHDDHIGGLSGALNACTVGALFSPVVQYDSKAFSSLTKYTQKQGIPICVPQVGDSFPLGSATVEFLSPQNAFDDLNDCSLVVRIAYGNTSMLFTGDAQFDAELAMVDSQQMLQSTLLKVGHHGSDTSCSLEFLREITPEYAIISVGKENTYGHPSEIVLNRLSDIGATVYRTDLHGTIICSSDGNKLSFSTEKGTNTPPLQPISSAVSVIDTPYVGNINSKKLHFATCPSVSDMKEKNKVPFTEKEDALKNGYSPCKACNP